MWRLWIMLVAIMPLIFAGCSGDPPYISGEPSSHYKIGKPYKIMGKWYYPKEDFYYDETGIASWYGPNFHGKPTANGEIFNQNDLTAAHNTLQIPSVARVTNLENGRSIVVRINDRGPFAHNRIIDLSRRSAQLLGMEKQGTAKVRVKVLSEESRALAGKAQGDGTRSSNFKSTAVTAAPRSNVQGETLLGEQYSSSKTKTVSEMMREDQSRLAEETKRRIEQQKVEQLPVDPTHSSLYIQAGAFSLQNNALRLQKTLETFGQTRVIPTIVHSGQRVWRVQLGPLSSLEVADNLLKSIINKGMQDAKIVVD